jgi:alpha-1,2-mannosyltransferase
MRGDFLVQASWLDESRVIGYARIFVCMFALATVGWIALSPGLIDPNGKPIGTDFMTVWSAGKLVLAGEPAAAYDYARHLEVQRQALPWGEDQETPYYGWHYPPFFMLVAAVLALLPYGAALAAWTAVTLSLYLAAIRAIVPYRHWLLLALAFPAVFVNLGHGQSGFLTAGLIGLGLLLLEKRPLLAGILFGLLAYKPHLGLLLPLALIADKRFLTFMSAALTTLTASFVSYIVLGAATWLAFVDSVTVTRIHVLEQGAMGWEKMQSVFAAMRMLGADIEAAYAVQAVVSICAAIAVMWIWRRATAMPLKCAALVTGTLLATPYVFDYDFTLLALPIAWLAVEGLRTRFLDWEKIALFAVWLLPIASRAIGSFGLPIAPVVLSILLVLILRRAASTTPVPLAARAA